MKLTPYLTLLASLVASMPFVMGQAVIGFGTDISPQQQVQQSKALAKKTTNPQASTWRAKGDQKRTYFFDEANATVPYRIVVPSSWDGKKPLPLVLFLHGGGSNENYYLDANNKLLVKLAEERGYLLVSPLGYQGAYGNSLRLPAVFGQAEEAVKMLAKRTPDKDSTNRLSEADVINVLELVLNEYPVDTKNLFLAGHSMGSGGTWYLAAKYPGYWNAFAPMSGPFIQESPYPWEAIKSKPIFMTEGLKALPSLEGSRAMFNWMKTNGFNVSYKEVDADHGGMVPLMLPEVFDFFDRCRK
jgi:predicted peptidase